MAAVWQVKQSQQGAYCGGWGCFFCDPISFGMERIGVGHIQCSGCIGCTGRRRDWFALLGLVDCSHHRVHHDGNAGTEKSAAGCERPGTDQYHGV